MNLTISEKLRIIIKRKNIKMQDVAAAMGYSRQNLARKLSSNTWSQSDLERIAAVLGCSVDVIFTDNNTGEQL